MTEIYDLTLHDNVHIDDAGYVTAGIRNGLALINAPGKMGPMISDITRDGVTLSVTIAHDSGNDFIPTSAIEGFRFFDGADEITISNIIKTNPNSFSLTLASLPISADKTLYYAYDAVMGINTDNILRDNSPYALPLRSAKVNVV